VFDVRDIAKNGVIKLSSQWKVRTVI